MVLDGLLREAEADPDLLIGEALGDEPDDLTLALGETGAEVLAMEVDRYLVEPLRSVVVRIRP